ncbi:MAG: hypothetical protein IT529_13320 [Burkholderiales bacterium]|nr:hypothetical protein [Burkholderiales bacterium]
MKRRLPNRLALALAIAPLAGGCAGGSGHLESFLNEVNPLDAAALIGVFILANVPEAGWSTRVAERGPQRYEIAVVRERWSGAGDGEFGRRFGEAAQRVAGEKECGNYTVLAYAERYEAALLGTRRVAEGLIECR